MSAIAPPCERVRTSTMPLAELVSIVYLFLLIVQSLAVVFTNPVSGHLCCRRRAFMLLSLNEISCKRI
jgi:hypothetical protein